MSWRERLPTIAAALWWGSLTAIGFVAVPLLFAHLPTATIAGQTAARLFTAQTWIGIGCGFVLLMSARSFPDPVRLGWGDGAMAFVAAGLLLALLGEFAVAPRIMARQSLALWHTLGTVFYALQWLCAGTVLWKLAGFRSSAPS